MTRPKTTVPLSNADAKRSVARFGRSPRTPAVPLLPPDADEQTWLDARRRGAEGYRVGASEMAAVLGVSPWSSPFALWWAKREGWQPPRTRGQRWGHKLEAVVAEVFAEDHPELLVCRAGAALWAHVEHPWVVCSPDFLAVSDTRDVAQPGPGPLVRVEPVECKSDRGGKGWGKPGTDEIPAHHRVQLLVQCAIFDAPRGHLVRNDTPYVVEYDDAARAEFATWVDLARTFVASLEANIPPEPDGHDATTKALVQLNPAVDVGEVQVVAAELAVEYGLSHDDLTAAKARFERAQNRVRAAMGRAEMAADPDGRVIAKRTVYKRRGYEVAPAVVDRLDRKQEGKAK